METLVGWVLWHINLCRLFNTKSNFIQVISTISMSIQFNCQNLFLFQAIQVIQTVLIQLIKFSISTDFVYTVKCQNTYILNN